MQVFWIFEIAVTNLRQSRDGSGFALARSAR